MECVLFVEKNSSLFTIKICFHKYETGNKNYFATKQTKISSYEIGPHCLCVHIFNKLPEIINIKNYLLFKGHLKSSLPEKQYYFIEDYLTTNGSYSFYP